MKEPFLQQETVIVPSKSILDQIYEALKERILLGKIAPGERIIESIIAQDFKTSRTPVRGAFQRLIQDGLVERVLQGGLRVTIITERMIQEIFGLRAVLEVYAAELACDNIEADTLLKLKNMSQQARELLSRPEANNPGGLMTLWQISTSFHETIYRAAGSEQLLKMISQLNNLVRRFRFLSLRKTRTRAWDEHDSIIRYLQSKDRAKLAKLMKAHVELAASDALKALGNDKWEKEPGGSGVLPGRQENIMVDKSMKGGNKMEKSRRIMKGFSLLLSAVLVASFLIFTPGTGQAKPVTLRLAHSEAVTNIRHDVCLFFVKRANELSKGDVKIDIFPAGAMGSHQACQQQVSVGVLDFYITTAGLVSVFDPTRIQELIELPYLFDNYSQAYAFMDTPYVAKFYEPLKAKGIHYLVTWDNGFRHMTNNVRPIYTPQDMKGLKIRVVQSEMSIDILQALGASAVPMSYAELYQAMQQKVVDGQENPFMNIYASKFYEVQKYMSLTKHQYSTLPIIISEMTWQKLDANQQNAILKAATEAAPVFRKLVGSNEDGQRKEMEKAGMKINDVSDLAPFRKAVEVVYDKAKKKWGADKVSELLAEVEKVRKKYPVGGKVYFGPEDR